MRTRYFFALAAVVLLASCNKELQTPEIVISKDVTVLEVGMAPVSKTYMGEAAEGVRKVYWSNGDVIAVNGVASEALAELADNTASASFTFQGLLSAPYNVLYPASIYKSEGEVELPAVQEYKAGGFADGVLPMAGYSEDGSGIAIDNLCAILKVSVKQAATDADQDDIVSVRFKGRNDEQVSGVFAIDYQNAVLNATSTAAADKEVKVVKSQATSVDAAAVYFIVVPAGEYVNGFDVVVKDKNGHIMTKSKTSAKTLEAGHLYDMAAFEFVPTATEIGVEINSAAALVQFATDFNNKVYASLGDEPLVAALTADIVFDAETSAAFNATGGIGLKETYGDAEDYYFDGLFNGNGYNIQGLEATAPIFKATSSSGKIANFIIDSSCSFTFTHSNEAELFAAAIVGYHKGSMEGCTVAANITLADAEGITQYTTIGGLAGRVTVGSISDCNYIGLISTPETFKTSSYLMIGGLAGRFTNSGSINSSYFKGAISNAAQVTSTDTSNPYLIIGGVAGHVDGGASISSTNTTNDHADEESAYTDFSGNIVNKTTVAYNSAVGGIVGELNNGAVSNCTNAANIAISVFKVGADGCRFMKTGGIVGKSNAKGSISGCTNNGTVQHRSNPKYQSLGGIAGYNAGAITACTNNAAVNQMTSSQSIKAGRYVYLGGVIGENIADNMVSNVHNTANLQISSMEDNTNSTECIGGVIGYNKGAIIGGITKDITNSGQVYHSPNFAKQFAGYYLGGIAGLTTAAIKNTKNTGQTYFRWKDATNGVSNVYLGGIAGKAEGSSSSIENCENIVDTGVTNSAQVYLYLPSNASYSDSYVGGIVGLSEATNPVKNCVNGGEVRTAAGASTVPVTGIIMGGIIGKMTGSGEVNNGDNSGRVRINFMACTESTDSHSGNYLGGIVGYVINESAVTVTGCDNSGNVDVSNSKGPVHDLIVSGVVGRMDAPGTIMNCNNNGGAINMAITAAAVDMYDLYVGGILGKSEQDVTITGCSNTGALSGGNSSSVAGKSFYMGGIVAYMKGASKILDCSNTGSTVSTQSGNNDNIGSTTLTGGIVGYVEGTSASPIEIGGTTGCTVNTSAAMSATRGWIGGVAAYAKYAQISKCTIESIIGGGCAARGAGGIVGKAEYCSISSSYYNGDQIKSNQIQAATGEGGIVGNLANSTIDGCYCYATKFYNTQSKPFGCIVGISGSNNTIQNCHYKSAVEGPTAGTAATAQVAGSGTFTDGGGNAADL